MAATFDGANRPVTWGELVDLLAKMELSPEVSAAKDTGDVDALGHEIARLSPYNQFTYPLPGPAGETAPQTPAPANPFLDDPEYLPCRLLLCACSAVCGRCGVGKMWDARWWPGQHDWCCSHCGASGVVTKWQKLSEMSEALRATTLHNCEGVIAEREAAAHGVGI